MSQTVEINHAVWALALEVKACPSYRRGVDEGLPRDSRTQAILDEIGEQARGQAQGITPVLRYPQVQGRATAKAPKTYEGRPCAECGTEFAPTHVRGKYCSPACSALVGRRRDAEAQRAKRQREAMAV